MSSPAHLEHLNPEQDRAVTCLTGPLLILAGAGSGKTRVLTRRVAHLLYEGVSSENVLAVTFTNKAASEMKERVAELAGEAGRKVWMSTFHSSCARILRMDIEALGYTRKFSIYDDDDQLRILKEILRRQGWDEKQYTPRAMLGRIDHYKNRLLDPDTLISRRLDQPHSPLVRVWTAYEEAMRAADAVDFNDLIGMTVRLFDEHPEVLAKWQERFQYVLVDEYQDTNQGQYRLLRLLADGHRNLAVVGDDDQSIYGFRGADISNILGFQRDYPEAVVVRLEQNYRSTDNILAVSNAVVAVNTKRMDKKLWTAMTGGRKVRLVKTSTAKDEASFVARAIQQLQTKHPLGDIAVIYRTNATSRLFEAELRRHRIPHRIVGGRKFYERREVRDVLSYIRLLLNPADDAAFLRVVNVPTRGVGPQTLKSLRADAIERGEPLLKTARELTSGSSRTATSLKNFVALVDELAESSRVEQPARLVAEVLERSGYVAMLRGDESRESADRLKNLNELVRDAASAVAPEDAITPHDRLRAWVDQTALAGQDEEIPEGGEVTLMTVHNAKGLEYPVVFVVHVMEGQFPHARSSEDHAGVEEERRLAYVAFTRAKKRLFITWNAEGAGADLYNRNPAYQRPTTAIASRFIRALPAGTWEGDDPRSEPAMAEPTTRSGLRGVELQRLGVLVRGHAAPEELRLLDIEDSSQLETGRRIHHADLGIGVIRGRIGAGSSLKLRVAFDTGTIKWIVLSSDEIHLVED